MLNISFFITVFTSVSWLIYSLNFIDASTFSTPNGSEILFQSIIISLFPIAVIWLIFSLIKNFFIEQRNADTTLILLEHLKKNTENINSLGYSIIAAEKEIKNGFILNEFNTLVSDINEILSDIIKRSNSISSAQIEHLWTRASGGEKWIIAKTFIEISTFQSGFTNHLLQKAQKDDLLKGSILEFHSRFKSLSQLLEHHDNQKIFFNMIQYGALGKSFQLLSPIVENLYQAKEPTIKTTALQSEKKDINPSQSSSEAFPSFLTTPKNTSSIQPEQTSLKNSTSVDIDSGLKAIRDELLAPSKPSTTIEKPTPIISSFSNTQSALRNFKIEPTITNKPNKHPSNGFHNKKIISLEELEEEINSSPENNYDENAYPFGILSNEKKTK